jgi:hypothetical protein
LLATAAPFSLVFFSFSFWGIAVVFFSFSFWGISVFTPNEVADGVLLLVMMFAD